MTDAVVDRVRAAVSGALRDAGRAVLAVSGGCDSMAMLDAALATNASGVSVATFDHMTGPHSSRAADLVEATAIAAGVPVTVGRADADGAATEASWREGRMAFLRAAAIEHRGALF